MSEPPPLRIDSSEAIAPETARALIGELVTLVKPKFPVVVDKKTITERPFPVVGPAIISSSVSTIESIAKLSELQREADSHSLLRDLVDRITTFAWLAVDPGTRVDTWEREDARKRLQVDDHVAEFGERVLEPGFRRHLEQMVARGGPSVPTLVDRAKDADQHWGRRVTYFDRAVRDGRVFEMLYATIFRYTSTFTHAAPMSVYKLVEDAPDQRIILLENTLGPQRALRFAPVAFAVLLFVASEVLGWPTNSEINAVFERHKTEFTIPRGA
jgi:hypothetical protein